MELIEIVLIMAAAIILSNIISKLIPAIPTFFIQIFLGVFLGMTELGQAITFEPDVFLLFIVAPLLFYEGQAVDLVSFVKHGRFIFYLAFGGVLFTLVIMGFFLHSLMPGIPLAACFVFGAALGPTDAVAVSSLASKLKIPDHLMHTLAGESLINDASGVTASQFAITALITGTFSVYNASFSLIMASVGGLAIGFIAIWVKNQTIRLIEQADAKDVITYLLIELLIPFISYAMAELLGVSGITAAVTAGILQSKVHKKATFFDARLANTSKEIWKTIEFTLNGIVFLFLGIELSLVFSPIWISENYSNQQMFLYIIILVVALFFVRMLFVSSYYLFTGGLKGKKSEILLLTFGGAKGTVSLAAIFILPVSNQGVLLEYRPVLLFLTACVILLSLIISMIALPLLTEDETEKPIDLNEFKILNLVVKYLETKKKEQPEQINETVVDAVIEHYHNRIWELTTESMTEVEQKKLQEFQAWMLSIEEEGLDECYEKGQISAEGYKVYNQLLNRYEDWTQHQFLSFISFWLFIVRKFFRVLLQTRLFFKIKRQPEWLKESRLNIEELQFVFDQNTLRVQERVAQLNDEVHPSVIHFFMSNRSTLLKHLRQKDALSIVTIEHNPLYKKEILECYTYERELINLFERDERMSAIGANNYRKKINLLESHAINKVHESAI